MAAETAMLVAVPTITLAPDEYGFLIAARDSPGLVFESATISLTLDDVLWFSKYPLTSPSALSSVARTGFPMVDNEPESGMFAPARCSW